MLNKKEMIAIFVFVGTGVIGWGIRIYEIAFDAVPAKLWVEADTVCSKPVRDSSNCIIPVKKKMLPVCVNIGNIEDLQRIKGVGPSLANKIVAYRNQHGEFKKIDDLILVKGIGHKKLEKIRNQIVLWKQKQDVENH